MTEGSSQSAAGAASEQVRAIVAAAEQSAAALEAAAREDAEQIRAEAGRDSARAREAAGRLAARADELERRLDELLAGVREAVEGLRADLADLRQKPMASAGGEPDGLDDELIAEVESVAAKEPDVRDPEQAAEPEGARVIALKMALDGASREETARYLSENFEIADAGALLDEVYAKAGR
jgi:F0F1-type ATP synthase membrane subunit b/b'